MEAKALTSDAEMVPVSKRDLIEAWSLLLRVVISLRTIGSHHALPRSHEDETAQQKQRRLDALNEFFTPELWQELSHARRVMEEYLPNDEAETLSEVLQYWSPKQSG